MQMAFYILGILCMVSCFCLLSRFDKLHVYLVLCRVYIILGILAFLCTLSSSALYGFVAIGTFIDSSYKKI